MMDDKEVEELEKLAVLRLKMIQLKEKLNRKLDAYIYEVAHDLDLNTFTLKQIEDDDWEKDFLDSIDDYKDEEKNSNW